MKNQYDHDQLGSLVKVGELRTDVNAEEDVALPLRGLEVVDLVVDLEPPDAAHKAGGGLQEVPCVQILGF